MHGDLLLHSWGTLSSPKPIPKVGQGFQQDFQRILNTAQLVSNDLGKPVKCKQAVSHGEETLVHSMVWFTPFGLRWMWWGWGRTQFLLTCPSPEHQTWSGLQPTQSPWRGGVCGTEASHRAGSMSGIPHFCPPSTTSYLTGEVWRDVYTPARDRLLSSREDHSPVLPSSSLSWGQKPAEQRSGHGAMGCRCKGVVGPSQPSLARGQQMPRALERNGVQCAVLSSAG